MTYYYVRDSGGAFTNLQLYALYQAKSAWDEVRAEYASAGEHTHQLKERCAFVVATLGLSVSQLLGQNNPTPKKTWVPAPFELLESFVTGHDLDPDLVEDFRQFDRFYQDVRHFGKTTSGDKYASVDQLTFDATRECFDTAICVWEAVLGVHGRELGGRLDDIDLTSDEDLLDVMYEEGDAPPWALEGDDD